MFELVARLCIEIKYYSMEDDPELRALKHLNKANMVCVYIPKGQEGSYAKIQQLAELRGLSVGKLLLSLGLKELEREEKTPHVAERIQGYVIQRGKLWWKADGSWTSREDEAMTFDEHYKAIETMRLTTKD